VSGGTDNHLILLDLTAQGIGDVLPPVGGQCAASSWYMSPDAVGHREWVPN